MIQSLSDAKRLLADMHNNILKSLEQKDTEIRRQAIGLLSDLLEEHIYSVEHAFSDEICFEAKQTFPDDWSSTGRRGHEINRSMQFQWSYSDEDSILANKGWNIYVWIRRSEYYHTTREYYSERLAFYIIWSVSQKKWIRIRREANESKSSPR